MTPPAFPDAAAVPGPFPAVGLAVGDRTESWLAEAGRLVRPRISVMVLATVASGFWLTAGQPESAVGFAALLLGTALVAASSSIANQILERDTDRAMARTAARPIAAGRLSVRDAWCLTAATLVLGSVAIWAGGGVWATVAAFATWLLYVLVYTPLKRVTPLNTAVGAVAGALPVAIGWCAAGGPARLAAGDARSTLAVAALATVLYLWQFPHFMAIAWLYRRQYDSAGLRMLTVVDPSGLRAAGQSLAAALAMLPASLVLAVPSGSIPLFLVAAVAAVAYVFATVRFAVRRDDASARSLLLTSLGSLLGLLTAAVAFGRPV